MTTARTVNGATGLSAYGGARDPPVSPQGARDLERAQGSAIHAYATRAGARSSAHVLRSQQGKGQVMKKANRRPTRKQLERASTAKPTVTCAGCGKFKGSAYQVKQHERVCYA
jgi:hypothetical protein